MKKINNYFESVYNKHFTSDPNYKDLLAKLKNTLSLSEEDYLASFEISEKRKSEIVVRGYQKCIEEYSEVFEKLNYAHLLELDRILILFPPSLEHKYLQNTVDLARAKVQSRQNVALVIIAVVSCFLNFILAIKES